VGFFDGASGLIYPALSGASPSAVAAVGRV
jgi:hypothetical protein